MYFGLNWLFNGEKDTNLKMDGPELPFDYDSFQWYNPFDWFGNYDKSVDAYNARKASESASKTRIYIYIASALLAIYYLRN